MAVARPAVSSSGRKPGFAGHRDDGDSRDVGKCERFGKGVPDRCRFMLPSGRLDSGACRRAAFEERNDLYLPSHSTASLHRASAMVGHQAISARSGIGQCEAGPLYLQPLLRALFLVCPIEADDFGPAAALALRLVPGSLGRRPIPQDRNLAARPACSGFEHESAARGSGPRQVLSRYSRDLGWGE